MVGCLVAEVAGDPLVEGVEQEDDDQPEDDLGGDAFLLDDLFVGFAFEGCQGIVHGWLDAGMAMRGIVFACWQRVVVGLRWVRGIAYAYTGRQRCWCGV